MTFVSTRQKLTDILRITKQNHRPNGVQIRFRKEVLEILKSSDLEKPEGASLLFFVFCFSLRNAKSSASFRESSDNPLVFSTKHKWRKEYAIAYMCQVSQWVGWHTKLDRVAITRDHRRRPAVPVQFASLERTCVDSAVRRDAFLRRLVTPIPLSSRVNRGCRWFFGGATFCKLHVLVKRCGSRRSD